MNGAEQDQTKREAEEKSWGCPYCRGQGQALVYDPRYDGHSMALRQVIERGEVIERPYPMTVVAHCLCPLGEWMRVRSDPDILHRIPLMADVLAGRSRYQVQDPSGDGPSDLRGVVPRRAVAGLAETMKAR